jgi:hypothetical protein
VDVLVATLWSATRLIDGLGLFTADAFLRSREEVIRRQQDELIEHRGSALHRRARGAAGGVDRRRASAASGRPTASRASKRCAPISFRRSSGPSRRATTSPSCWPNAP